MLESTPMAGEGFGGEFREVMLLRSRQHKRRGTVDIHTVFLKEYAVQVHSKACFEASFCPLLLHCRYLSTIDSPPHAPEPLPRHGLAFPAITKGAPRSLTQNKKRASAHKNISETKQPTASNFPSPTRNDGGWRKGVVGERRGRGDGGDCGAVRRVLGARGAKSRDYAGRSTPGVKRRRRGRHQAGAGARSGARLFVPLAP